MAMDGAADQRVKPELLRDTFKLVDFEPQSVYNERKRKTLFNPPRSSMKQHTPAGGSVHSNQRTMPDYDQNRNFFDKRNPNKS
jgi:hypothetical protein